MGYTHYFETVETIDKNTWKQITDGFGKILTTTNVRICGSDGHTDTPIKINENLISFNGFSSDSHETMVLQREKSDWNFCKTAMKPYDEVVVALLSLVMTLTDNVKVSSDGEIEDWKEGKDLLYKSIPELIESDE